MEVEFGFRVWVHPVDGDPPEIEVWYPDLERTGTGSSPVSEWARESLCNEDFHELFRLDPDSHWQVYGRASLSGAYDYFGEYDEDFKVLHYKKAKMHHREGD